MCPSRGLARYAPTRAVQRRRYLAAHAPPLQLHDDFSSKANSPASPKRLSAIAPERDPPFYQTPMGVCTPSHTTKPTANTSCRALATAR